MGGDSSYVNTCGTSIAISITRPLEPIQVLKMSEYLWL